MSFNIENKVLLNFRNIKITKSIKKLNYKYYDSFEIELSIWKHTYRFRLFNTFRSIHNVFYVSLLKSHRSDFEEQSSSVLMKEEKHWKIKKILKSRIYYDKLQYFVKELKYFDSDKKWLKDSWLDEIQELIRAFSVRFRQIYITLIISFRARTRNQIKSEQMKFNLISETRTKEKENTTQFTSQHYFHFRHYFHYHFSKRHYLFFLFHQRSSFSCACDSKSQSFESSWSSLFEELSISYLFFFLHLFFRRDFFVCVDFCLRHVNEIRNLIVIKSMIVVIFFIYFVDETKSITLCSLAKSKRRCLKEFIQRQKTSRIFSTIHNFCCAKRATRIFLWIRFNWVIWIFQTL